LQTLLLYAAVVLIWGSTWAAIPYQLGSVPVELSIGYRFAIASLALYLYAFASRRKLRLPRAALPFVFLQGALLFSLNYILVYYATARLTSGLVAVLFSSIVICNAFFERIFFGAPGEGRVLLAALLGLAGTSMIFWPEVSSLSLHDDALAGILLAFASVLLASLGNMVAVVNTRRRLPVVAVNAHSMLFAAALVLTLSLLFGVEVKFSAEPGYLLSLGYLALFGSALAFGCYLALIGRIGAARASYSSVLLPVVALLLSTLFEGYRWTPVAAVGMMLTLAGNWLVLKRPVRQ
jgi:drug/metabolite transporter (DMT)-like permease